jgi:hypothetical protein
MFLAHSSDFRNYLQHRRKDMRNNNDDELLSAFGFLVNAFGGGGDYGQLVPRSDAEDLSLGLRFIPGEVTWARRNGERVVFVQSCQNQCCWYWLFPDGSKTFYWERSNFEQIKEQNGGNDSPCPNCGNPYTSGGHIDNP